jgi:hypothetical protein
MPSGEKFWKNKILVEEAIRIKDRPPAELNKYLIPRFTNEPIGVRLTTKRRDDILLRDDLTL